MDERTLSMGERVIDWLTTQLEDDFSKSQASAITVAILYGVIFKDHLREFFNEHIDEIIAQAAQEDGEASGD